MIHIGVHVQKIPYSIETKTFTKSQKLVGNKMCRAIQIKQVLQIISYLLIISLIQIVLCYLAISSEGIKMVFLSFNRQILQS